MPKNEEKKRVRNVATGLTIDVGIVVQRWNEAHPELKPMTKKSLAEKIGVHPMVFGQWSKQAPYIAKAILELAEIGDCTPGTFIIQKEEETTKK